MATPLRRFAHDLVALTKPGIVRMAVLMAAGGAMLAHHSQRGGQGAVASRADLSVDGGLAAAELAASAAGGVPWLPLLTACIGTALAVASANVFNQWWEREGDAAMARTRRRPLPAGRLSAPLALWFAWVLGAAGLAVFVLGSNVVAAGLAVLAIAGYVLVYTPLKRISPLALPIGALPGAMPPLLGWAAITGGVEPGGLALFAILVVWQMPHFLAIALFRKREYAAAGIRTVPVVYGDAMAKIEAVAWALLLVPVSLLLAPLGVAGPIYTWSAFALGMAFVGWAFTGLDDRAGDRWARGFFVASLLYLPALVLALGLDVLSS